MQKKMIGRVVSDKMQKTRRVEVDRVFSHPKYGKTVTRRTVCHVHDEGDLTRTGDVVEIIPCRPMSKMKRFALIRIIERGGESSTSAQAQAADSDVNAVVVRERNRSGGHRSPIIKEDLETLTLLQRFVATFDKEHLGIAYVTLTDQHEGTYYFELASQDIRQHNLYPGENFFYDVLAGAGQVVTQITPIDWHVLTPAEIDAERTRLAKEFSDDFDEFNGP